MVWATFAMQSGRPERARPLLVFPPEAATRDLASKFAVHPWKLETMLTEVLTTPKLKLLPNHPNRRLDCRKFEAIARATNALTSLENAEDGLTLERINVLREIPNAGCSNCSTGWWVSHPRPRLPIRWSTVWLCLIMEESQTS